MLILDMPFLPPVSHPTVYVCLDLTVWVCYRQLAAFLILCTLYVGRIKRKGLSGSGEEETPGVRASARNLPPPVICDVITLSWASSELPTTWLMVPTPVGPELILGIPKDIRVLMPVLSKASELPPEGGRAKPPFCAQCPKLVPSGMYQAGEAMVRHWSHSTRWPWTVLPSLFSRKFYVYGMVGWKEALPNAKTNNWGPERNIQHPCAHSLLKLQSSTLRCTWPPGAKVTDAGFSSRP